MSQWLSDVSVAVFQWLNSVYVGMFKWLNGVYSVVPEQGRAAVIAAVVAAIVSLIVSYIAARATKEAAQTTANAAKNVGTTAAQTSRDVTALTQRLDRLLIPAVADSMIDAMKDLWVITGRLPRSTKTEFIDLHKRINFVKGVTKWYYTKGNGLFLSPETRDVLFKVRCSALRPCEAEKERLDLQYERFFRPPLRHPDRDEELAMHLLNDLTKLREKIKAQLGIYGVWNEPPLQGVPRSSIPSAIDI